MISVSEALDRIFALVAPLDTETVSLRHAAGRVLAAPVTSTRAQPPFAASIMDGYGVPETTVAPGDTFTVIGEAAAGRGFGGVVAQGQAVRIFTGASVPAGVERVIIQEDVTRENDVITVAKDADSAQYIRPLGADFEVGQKVSPFLLLAPAHIALLAAMNVPRLTVTRRPVVALIATGDELVMPGETPRADQIIASNALGLAAMVEKAGGIPRILPIARDSEASLNAVFGLTTGADLIVTIGGASVGDHDLVGKVAATRGMDRAFHKVAMRPGKPLMSGTLDGRPMIGLPGNPVSSIVCGHIFMLPAINAMLGLPPRAQPRRLVALSKDLPENGPREHYMRAVTSEGSVTPFQRQDSALLSVLAEANALIVRPPHDPARVAGDSVEVIAL